jgi:hypothetical protein
MIARYPKTVKSSPVRAPQKRRKLAPNTPGERGGPPNRPPLDLGKWLMVGITPRSEGLALAV